MRYPSMKNAQRGSVLVFAVIVLAILFLLASSFMFVVRQSRTASTNAVNSTVGEAAAQSGLNVAVNSIRQAFSRQIVNTPEGVIDGAGAPYVKFGNRLVDGVSEVSILDLFRDETTNPDWVPLSDPTSATDLRFTISELYLSNNLEDPARPNHVVTPLYAADPGLDFDPAREFAGLPLSAGEKLRALGRSRGEYYVWISDLDSKLYCRPDDWGIDPADPATTPIVDIQRNILEALKAEDDTLFLSPTDVDNILANPTQAYKSISEFSLSIDSLATTYYPLRADLDFLFSANLDDTFGTKVPQVKSHPGAVNINTATLEMIEIMLGQIPTVDELGADSTLGLKDPEADGTSLARHLAERIVEKRPFICRMDMEDFFAAHLIGDVANTATPVGMIKACILKREDPSKPGFSELSVHQYMEVAGDLEDPDQYDVYAEFLKPSKMETRFDHFASGITAVSKLTVKEFNNILNSISTSRYVGPDKQLLGGDDRQLLTVGQQGEIVIFSGVDETLQATVPGAPALNDDVVNDVIFPGVNARLESALAGDDVAVKQAGVYFVVPGTDGILQTAPAGDDRKVPAILTGPNHIADTSIFGYSYYSHDFTPQVYNFADVDLFDPPIPDVTNPEFVGKFVYDYANIPSTPGAYEWKITDLLRWSCVGDGKRSGFYDMFFTDDVMNLSLDEDAFPNETEVCVSAGANGLLQTYAPESVGDDDEEVPDGLPAFDQFDVVVGPGFDGVLDSVPKKDDQVVQAIVSQTYLDAPASEDALAGDDIVDGTGLYIVPGTNGLLDTPLDAADQYVDVIIAGPNEESNSPNNDIRVGETIIVNEWAIADSFVWGPIRASQRRYDMKLDSNKLQAPNATLTSGSRANGDVSWSPAFAFRSRFYAVYVLGRGAIEKADLGPAATATDIEKNVKLAGETRLEAVYDALKDEVLWQRTQLSEKRALGEP